MEALVLAVAWTKDQRPLLDLRPREAFQRAHLKGSTSLPYALLLHRGASSSDAHDADGDVDDTADILPLVCGKLQSARDTTAGQ